MLCDVMLCNVTCCDLIYRKAAWFELTRKQGKNIKIRGGGLSQQFSPSADPPPQLSQAGINNDDDIQINLLQRISGTYDYILPERKYARSQVREMIHKR